MKRDWNLIRQIMLAIENETFASFLETMGGEAPVTLNDHDYAAWLIKRKAEFGPVVQSHLLMLKEGGLLEGDFRNLDSIDTSQIRITMSGYDALEIFKLEEVWTAIASAVRADKCPLTIAAILEVSKAITISKIKNALNL